MDIAAYQEAIKQGKTVDFYVSIKKWGCIGTSWLIGTIILCSLMFLGSIGLFIIYGIGPVLEASSDSFRGGAVGSTFLSGLILFVIVYRVFLYPDRILSVNNKGLTVYDILTGDRSDKIHLFFIPWTEILDMNTEIIEEKFALRTSCIVLKCTAPTTQKIQQHRKQAWDELSKKKNCDKRFFYKTYEVMDDLVKINISSYLTIPTSDILTLLQELHKNAITAQQ